MKIAKGLLHVGNKVYYLDEVIPMNDAVGNVPCTIFLVFELRNFRESFRLILFNNTPFFIEEKEIKIWLSSEKEVTIYKENEVDLT